MEEPKHSNSISRGIDWCGDWLEERTRWIDEEHRRRQAQPKPKPRRFGVLPFALAVFTLAGLIWLAAIIN